MESHSVLRSSMCPYQRGVCNSGVWIRGVSAIQGSGLEGSTVHVYQCNDRNFEGVMPRIPLPTKKPCLCKI